MKLDNQLQKEIDHESLKPSRYNHFFKEIEGDILAYNAFSNSFASVSKKNHEIILKILEEPDRYPCQTDEHLRLKEDLVKGGFLIDSNLCELEILKAQNRIGRFGSKTLSLTIAPTLLCNFKCVYCFESPKPDTITAEVENALLKYVDRKMVNLTRLHVSWFGGEPLLKIDIIERLTNAFEKLCKKHNAVLGPASIITNGFLLTRDAAKRLKKANIKSAQVTLDGTQDIHDRRRKLIDGQGSFQQILENIKKASDILPVCGGGCVYNGSNSLENKECNFWKYNLEDMLGLKYNELMRKKTQNGG
jgi:uncharacterized protein